MSDFTNLKNSYMYGQANRQNNYFQNYKNFNNDIDDPIYTGFTLSFDTLKSPLFFNNYTINDGLSGKIEKNLENVWNTISSHDEYDIISLISRDEFSDSSYIGYGLQMNTFSEEILYGAADYIYMVDSDHKPNNDEEKINELNDDNNSDISQSDLNSATTNDDTTTNDNNSQNIQEEIDKKKQEIEDAQKKYDEMLNNSTDEDDINIAAYEAQLLDEYKKTIADLKNAQDKLNKKIALAEKYKTQISNLNSKTATQIKSYDGEGILSIWVEYSNVKNEAIKDGVSVIVHDSKTLKDKDFKKNLAKKWFNDENINKIDTNEKSELLSAYVNVGFSTANELNEAVSYEKKLNEPLQTPMFDDPRLSTLRQIGEELLSHPSETEKLRMNIESLKQELDELLNKQNGNQNNTSSEETYNEVTPTSQETQNNSNNQNQYNNPVPLPQSVLDMVGFTSEMKRITEYYPYIFLNVSGLETAYKKYHQIKDPYYGSGDDRISIDCLESLDMKVSSMFSKYFNAVYDRQFRRERVPVNLRKFNCSIFVHDIRNFREALAKINSIFRINKDGDNLSSKILEVAYNYLSVVEFKFFDCEIDPEETGGIFESVSNESMSEPLKTKFTFKYGNCVINFLPFGDLLNSYNIQAPKDQSSMNKDIGNFTTNTKSEMYEKIDNNYSTDNTIEYNENELGLISSNRELSNIIDDNIVSTNYRKYWDKSELGNVNNDDYNDYIKRDHATAADDFIRNQYSDMFVNNSIGEIQKASTELDNALHRTILGISASIGEPPTTVADALGVGYLNNVWHPQPTTVITDLGNFDLSAKEGETISNLGNYDLSAKTGDTTIDLGNYDLSAVQGETISDLGNYDLSAVQGDVISNLGNFDLSAKTGDTTIDLGNYDLSAVQGDVISNLGNFDLSAQEGDTISNLGNYDLSAVQGETISDLGNYDLSAVQGDTITDLGNYDLSAVQGDTITDLGNYDLSAKKGDIISDLGKFDLSSKTGENIDDLGKFDLSSKTGENIDDLGKFDLSAKTGDTITDLGNYDLSIKEGDTISDLGKYDLSTKQGENIDNLGKYDLSAKTGDTITKLGKFDLSAKQGENIDDLGKYDLSAKEGNKISNLGKFDMSTQKGDIISDLGKYDLSAKQGENIDDLGKYDLSAKTGEKIINLGKFDLSSKTGNEIKDLGKFDLSTKKGDVISDLGKFDLSTKQGENIDNLGKYDLSAKTGEKIINLGKFDMSTQKGDTITDLGKFDLSAKTGENIDNLGKFDLSTQEGDTISDLGKYDLSSKTGNTITNLGEYDLSSKTGNEIKDLGKFDLSAQEGENIDDLGKTNQESKQTDETKKINKTETNQDTVLNIYRNLGNVFLN